MLFYTSIFLAELCLSAFLSADASLNKLLASVSMLNLLSTSMAELWKLDAFSMTVVVTSEAL
jgi:hypothetical protein